MSADEPNVRTVEPPPATDILRGVAEFLEEEVYPSQEPGKIRFRVRVAANLLRLVDRELADIGTFAVDPDGYAVTPAVLAEAGSLQDLAMSLRSGKRSIVDGDVYETVRAHVEAKVRISAPGLVADE